MCWWFPATVQHWLLGNLCSCCPLEYNSDGSCAFCPFKVKILTGWLHPSLFTSPSWQWHLYAQSSRMVLWSWISAAMPKHQWYNILQHTTLHLAKMQPVWSQAGSTQLLPAPETVSYQLWFPSIEYWPLSFHLEWLYSCGLHQWLSHVHARWYNHWWSLPMLVHRISSTRWRWHCRLSWDSDHPYNWTRWLHYHHNDTTQLDWSNFGRCWSHRWKSDTETHAHDTSPSTKSVHHPIWCYWNYRSIIGKLNFLVQNTCPDISMPVHMCTHYVNSPNWSHQDAVKYLWWYLHYSWTCSLILKPTDNNCLNAYVDSDFAGMWSHATSQLRDSTISHISYIITFCGCPIHWVS